MKNLNNIYPIILFSIVVFFSAFTTQGQNINFPDLHLKTVLVANPLINTNGDGEIQKSEAIAFTGAVNVSNSTIYDMTGIEYFVNMTALNCSNNDLVQIDLNSNVSLMRLDCSINNLFDIDLTNNTELRLLDIHSNHFQSIDLTANILLARLLAQNNHLQILDLNSNSYLQQLDCSNNDLTSLDVSDNTMLFSVNCSDNQLSFLNLANNNNVNINSGSVNAINNKLNCVKVDDKSFSDLNWANSIDAFAFYSNSCNSVPVSTATSSYLNVFPNPAADVISVYFGGEFVRVRIDIYNVSGGLVYSNTIHNKSSVNLDLDFNAGIYMMAVNTGEGETITKKIIKK
jgi:hypothetical protein